MKTRLPIKYMLFGTPKRHRSAKYKEFREWIDIDIQEVATDEAPIAIRHKDRSRTTEIRWFDDRFWGRCSYFDDATEAELMSLNTAEKEGDVKGSIANYADHRAIEAILRDGVHAYDPETFKADRTLEREVEVEKVMMKVSNSIVLDGELWCSQRHPILTYRNGDYTTNAIFREPSGISGDLSQAYPNMYSPKKNLSFSVNRSHEEIETVIRAFEWEGNVVHPDVDVLIPDIFTLDVDAFQMKFCATDILTDLWSREMKRSKSSVFDVSVPILRQIADLKEILQTNQELVQTADAISEQLGRFLDELDALEIPESWHGDSIEKMTLLSKWWQERDLEIDFDPPSFR